MNTFIFLVIFAAGAAALAVWTDVRFEGRRPTELRGALIHLMLAWCIAQFLTGLLMDRVATALHPLAAVMVVALPITVYCLLSMLWLMRLASGALKSRFE